MKTNLKRQILGFFMVLCLITVSNGVAFAGKASAKFTSTSSSSITLKLVWQAWGCAGIKYGYTRVCSTKKLTISGNSTKTSSYKYKWGTSGRKLYVLCNSGSKRLITEGTKNGRSHTFTIKTGQIIASRSRTLKNESCIK